MQCTLSSEMRALHSRLLRAIGLALHFQLWQQWLLALCSLALRWWQT